MRSRAPIIVLLVLAAAVLVAPIGAQGADEGELQALTQKVEALEQRIATMERNLTQQLNKISQQLSQGGGGGGANAALEAEAEAAYGSINRLVAAGDLQKAKGEMTTFMQKYGTTNTAKKARRTYQELSVIGKTAPDNWGIEKWFQGESDISLNDGKCTLVVFWETWCPHCQREVPKLQALYDNLKGDGLQVIGLTKVTKSSTEEKVSEFITQKSVTYPVAKENGQASQYFNVSGIPAAAVVKDGKVIWRGHPARLSEQQLRDWL